MKYIKLFMIAAATVFCAASCSDDENYNTTGKTTIEFESTAMTVDENTDLFDVPVKVSGARNGKVRFVIKTEEVGESPAKEDVNYMVTSKSVSLNADTLASSTMNVQVKAVDDRNMNADRTFKITIVSADGATIGTNSSVTVTKRTTTRLISTSSAANGKSPVSSITPATTAIPMLRSSARICR